MDDFKVSVESLHTARIREINYEGEETYQERLTLSQRLTDLAQRVDFSDFVKDNTDDTGPAVKKPAQKWPWEFTHSKLKQALTEVSVLSDLLQITQNHRQYLVLDPVAAPQPTGVSPVFQFLAKKKALSVAAGILRSGTKTLSKISSKSEREFHKTLLQLRERWKLRRTPAGIVGDLSFCQMDKSMSPWVGTVSALQFEVHKRESLGTDLANILSITIPRELRGRSEVVVFISDKPIREVDSLSTIPRPPLFANQQQKALPLWEEKLAAAQNILFNQELFFQFVREAREHKTCLQLEILTNRVNIPLTTGHWISVLHVRDYSTTSEQSSKSVEGPPPQSNGSAEGLPPVRWELVVALKQLLRANHHRREALNAPRPSIASFNEPKEVREAGVRALTGVQIKELEYRSNLFARFLQMSKHLCNEQSFKQWLLELKASCSDPVVMVTWVPDPSLTSISAFLHLSTPSRESSHTLEVQLSVDTVTIQQINGIVVKMSFDKERIIPLLKHQVVLYQTQLVQRVAVQCKWHVMQSFAYPLPSCALNRAGTAAPAHTVASNIVLESDDATKRLDVLLEWGKVSLSLALLPANVVTEENIAMLKPKVNTFQLGAEHGQHLVERFRNMLACLG